MDLSDSFGLIIIFGFVLAMVGMTGWFRLQRTRGQALGAGDREALARALAEAERLEKRIESLERVLDEDLPGWRRRVPA